KTEGAHDRPSRALLSNLQSVFPLWTDAGKARDALRLSVRIYNYHAQQSARGAVSQMANGCAAHDWGQMLTFRVKTCSLFRSFTKSVKKCVPHLVNWAKVRTNQRQ